jgi:hypothetical protein
MEVLNMDEKIIDQINPDTTAPVIENVDDLPESAAQEFTGGKGEGEAE